MDKMSLHHSTRATHALRHQESFRSAVHSIHDAVNRAMVSDKKYTKVAVLSLRWDNGDLTCDGFLERDLLHTFRDIFHYNIESFLIPSIATRKAATAVREKIQDFVDKYDSETSLLIFVYMGHSATETAQTLKIYGSADPGSTALKWSYLEAQMIADGDVLVIMDSCYSGAAAMGPGEFEYLVASGFESPAAAHPPECFSRRLTDLLKNLPSPEITVAQIHAQLVKQANKRGSQLDYTPVHVASKGKPSITLRPLLKMQREVNSLRKSDELADGKVLVSVLLQGKTSVPDVKQWQAWLSNHIPENVADIKIEAVFESHSSLCLLTMPTAVWNMLKHDSAYQFIAYVESRNILGHVPQGGQFTGTLEAGIGNLQLGRMKGVKRPFVGEGIRIGG